MEQTVAGLAHLPVDRTYLLAAAAVVVVLAAARTVAARRPAGRALLRGLHGAEASLLALLLGSMILLSFVQIVLRNVAHTGLVWVDPLLRHILLWLGFLGAALATRLERHINIDALSRLLGGPWLRAARAATSLVTAGVCLLLSNACLKMLRAEAGAGTTSFLGLPTWITQLVMPVAMLLMSYRFLRHAVEAARGQEPEKAPSLLEMRP